MCSDREEPPPPVSLLDARPGQAHRIEAIALPGPLGDRLLELGLTPSAPVRVLRRAPLGGPLQIEVRGFLLTLRRELARFVQVRPCALPLTSPASLPLSAPAPSSP